MEIVASLSRDEMPIKSEKAVRNAWQAYTALADRYNEPGRFTALIGFEWIVGRGPPRREPSPVPGPSARAVSRHHRVAGTRVRRAAVLLAFLLGLAPAAEAHEVRPAYLELRETWPDRYDVLWKVPALGDDLRLSLAVRFPAGTRNVTEPRGLFRGGAHVERWQIERPGGVGGQRIDVEGLSSTRIDTLVRMTASDGSTQAARATPDSPSVTLAVVPSAWNVAGSYLARGVEHILGGIDHLLFVVALLLIVRGRRRILLTISAFTVAHSITLAAATLGWVHVPAPPVEAMIALSIVFVAAEIAHGLRGKAGLAARAPWVVAFSFGLLHGFGFAGALSEVGLPETAIPIALLMFNVGVEIGQLLIVVAALALGAAVARLPLPKRQWISYAAPYAIGTVAMFWVIERVAAFF
jgi:hydrogenase/urease accessory protein HupE